MTAPPSTIKATIGGVTLALPVYHDPHTTLAIVARVNERLKEVEEQSTRIDTQAFALATAFAFAVEAEQTRRDAEQEAQELTKALARILSTLDDIITTYQLTP